MIKKTFTVTKEENKTLDDLKEFFNEKTHQKTLVRVLEFARTKLIGNKSDK